jgi:hypothetical protein
MLTLPKELLGEVLVHSDEKTVFLFYMLDRDLIKSLLTRDFWKERKRVIKMISGLEIVTKRSCFQLERLDLRLPAEVLMKESLYRGYTEAVDSLAWNRFGLYITQEEVSLLKPHSKKAFEAYLGYCEGIPEEMSLPEPSIMLEYLGYVHQGDISLVDMNKATLRETREMAKFVEDGKLVGVSLEKFCLDMLVTFTPKSLVAINYYLRSLRYQKIEYWGVVGFSISLLYILAVGGLPFLFCLLLGILAVKSYKV